MGLTQGWLVLGSWLVVKSCSRLAHETKKTRISKTASSSPFKNWTSTPVFRSRLPWTVRDGVAKSPLGPVRQRETDEPQKYRGNSPRQSQSNLHLH